MTWDTQLNFQELVVHHIVIVSPVFIQSKILSYKIHECKIMNIGIKNSNFHEKLIVICRNILLTVKDKCKLNLYLKSDFDRIVFSLDSL